MRRWNRTVPVPNNNRAGLLEVWYDMITSPFTVVTRLAQVVLCFDGRCNDVVKPAHNL